MHVAIHFSVPFLRDALKFIVTLLQFSCNKLIDLFLNVIQVYGRMHALLFSLLSVVQSLMETILQVLLDLFWIEICQAVK